MVHELKILPAYFEAVCEGRKNFEIRNNSDRGFNAGDAVKLQEWCPIEKDYTGNFLDGKITYVTNFAQKENYVVFGFRVVN